MEAPTTFQHDLVAFKKLTPIQILELVNEMHGTNRKGRTMYGKLDYAYVTAHGKGTKTKTLALAYKCVPFKHNKDLGLYIQVKPTPKVGWNHALRPQSPEDIDFLVRQRSAFAVTLSTGSAVIIKDVSTLRGMLFDMKESKVLRRQPEYKFGSHLTYLSKDSMHFTLGIDCQEQNCKIAGIPINEPPTMAKSQALNVIINNDHGNVTCKNTMYSIDGLCNAYGGTVDPTTWHKEFAAGKTSMRIADQIRRMYIREVPTNLPDTPEFKQHRKIYSARMKIRESLTNEVTGIMACMRILTHAYDNMLNETSYNTYETRNELVQKFLSDSNMKVPEANREFYKGVDSYAEKRKVLDLKKRMRTANAFRTKTEDLEKQKKKNEQMKKKKVVPERPTYHNVYVFDNLVNEPKKKVIQSNKTGTGNRPITQKRSRNSLNNMNRRPPQKVQKR